MGSNGFSSHLSTCTTSAPPVIIDITNPASENCLSEDANESTTHAPSSATANSPPSSHHPSSTGTQPTDSAAILVPSTSPATIIASDRASSFVASSATVAGLLTESSHPTSSTSANATQSIALMTPTPPTATPPTVSSPASFSASPSASASISTSPASAGQATLTVPNRNVSEGDSLAYDDEPPVHRRQVALSHRSDDPARLQAPFSRRDDRVLAVYTLVVVVVSIYVVARHQDSPDDTIDSLQETVNNSYLRLWLIVNTVFATFRLIGRVILHAISSRQLRTFRSVLAWTLRILNFIVVAWFITGTAWLIDYGSNASAYMRNLMTVIITIELSIVAIAFILAVVVFSFAVRPVMANRHSSQGATKEQLSKLPVITYNPENCSAHSCSICLCDFEQDEVLRQLPCSSTMHIFHAACVDEWLMQKLSCPICRDDPLNPRASPSSSQVPPPPLPPLANSPQSVNSPPPVAADP